MKKGRTLLASGVKWGFREVGCPGDGMRRPREPDRPAKALSRPDFDQRAVYPPSTASVVPVIEAAASLQKNTTMPPSSRVSTAR